jgi:hypothetical protein
VHKFSSINYLLNTAYNYPITKEATETELNTIKGILLNPSDPSGYYIFHMLYQATPHS